MYGLNNFDLINVKNKIKSQKEYLLNNRFTTSSGQVKSFFDVSFSANISERYYSQLSNKINTMQSLATTLSLVPVFLTVTLDGYFRDFIKGDFTRFDKFSSSDRKKHLKHVPNNDVYGYLRYKIDNHEQFTVKDCYNVLAFQWYKFCSASSFKYLKRDGLKFSYLKSVEPHKDGVPHLHVLLWIPNSHIELFKKDFVRYFPAPRNHKPLPNTKNDTYGFQTNIINAVGYVMKYVTKSFINIKSNDDLTYLQAWYVKNKIRRLTTSHFTLPQWIYQKCYSIESDWFHLTDLTNREPELCEWNRKENYFILIERDGRTIEYNKGLLTLKYIDSKFILKQTGAIKQSLSTNQVIDKVPTFWQNKPIFKKPIECFIDDKKYLYKDGQLTKPTIYPKLLSNFELYEYFHEGIDYETVNPHHYALVFNTMIDRGLLKSEHIPLISDVEHYMWGIDVEDFGEDYYFPESEDLF